MSQSCGGADNKNSDSETTDTETENAATEKEESSENSSGISFKIVPEIWKYERGWRIHINYKPLIVCDDSGSPIMYDDENAVNYDSFAFAFFCAKSVVDNYDYDYNDNSTFSSESEAFNKWKSDYAIQLEPYLGLCLNMPVAANVCPPHIQELFNEVYYDYKDKNMYLEDSGYGFRKYIIGNSSLRIYRYDNEDYPEYYGALAIHYY